MPTRNRGKHSSDDKWFADKWQPVFKEAVDDLCYLLSRGYTENTALQVVGNRYKLNKRQRTAMLGMSSSDQDISIRKKSRCPRSKLKNRKVEIDGFNLLILLESALSGAYIFKGRDGTFRDISGVHGSYKRVVKTEEAILLVGHALNKIGVKSATWFLDKPISNSGRLKSKLLDLSALHQFNWQVELVFSPDKVLAKSDTIVISSDGWILNHAKAWFNLSAYLIENYLKESNVIDV